MAKITPLAKAAPPAETVGAFSSGIVKRRKLSRHLVRVSAFLFVVAPTVLAALYYAFIAANQYEVRTLFAVRGLANGSDVFGFTQLIGSGAVVNSDSYIVVDYIESTEIIEDIKRDQNLDLREIFASDKADWLVRADPNEPINLFVDYWRGRIDVGFNSTTGIITFEVRAFSAEDAATVAQAVLTASEQLVNVLSSKARQELVHVARAEVERTEARGRAARQAIQEFREREQTIDPSQLAAGQLKLLSEIEGQLVELRARRDALLQSVDPSSPSVRVLDRQIGALERQIEEQRGRLGSGQPADSEAPADPQSRTLSRVVGDYTQLAVEQEFAEKAYTTALAALEAAISEGRKQQRYFAVFVEPRAPEISLHPERLTNTALIFVASLGLWGLVLLMVLAIREHSL